MKKNPVLPYVLFLCLFFFGLNTAKSQTVLKDLVKEATQQIAHSIFSQKNSNIEISEINYDFKNLTYNPEQNLTQCPVKITWKKKNLFSSNYKTLNVIINVMVFGNSTANFELLSGNDRDEAVQFISKRWHPDEQEVRLDPFNTPDILKDYKSIKNAANQMTNIVVHTITPNTGIKGSYDIDIKDMKYDVQNDVLSCYVLFSWYAKITRFHSDYHNCKLGGTLQIHNHRTVTFTWKDVNQATKDCELDSNWRDKIFKLMLIN